MLHYDSEYKAEDADFEACLPVSGGEGRDGIKVRELPGGRCVSLPHQGPMKSWDDPTRRFSPSSANGDMRSKYRRGSSI